MTEETAVENAEKPADKKDWLAEHIKYLSALKAPTDTQKLLILLAGKVSGLKLRIGLSRLS